MQFNFIQMEDKKDFDYFLKDNELYNQSNYERDFTTLFCFSTDLNIKIAKEDKAIYILSEEDGIIKFYPPIVKEKDYFLQALSVIQEYCNNLGIKMIIEGITLSQKAIIDSDKKSNYYLHTDRDNYEYLYLPKRFFHYDNSLQHYKVEQIKAFEKRVPHYFKDYENSDLTKIEQLFIDWLGNRKISEYDYLPMIIALKNYDKLKLVASCMYTNDTLIGVSIAHIDEHNVGTVLFEKAEHKYFGSYACMVSYVAKNKLEKCKYINRQEDMGIEGLRISKLSYLVDEFIQKFVLTNGFSYNK